MSESAKTWQNCSTNYLSAPPMASTISLHSFIGGGNGFGSRPRIKAKSTWKRRPSSVRRRLSRCLERREREKNVIIVKFAFLYVVSLSMFNMGNFIYQEKEDVKTLLQNVLIMNKLPLKYDEHCDTWILIGQYCELIYVQIYIFSCFDNLHKRNKWSKHINKFRVLILASWS